MKMYRIFRKLFKPTKCKWMIGSIVCPRCGSIAFHDFDTPQWMTKGYCFRCGKYLSWDVSKEDLYL